MRINRPIIGFILGALAPVIGFIIVYLVMWGNTGFASFVHTLVGNHKTFAMVLSLSILANVVPFIIFTNKRLDYAARGVFIATMLYAVAIVLLKFVG